MKYLFLLPLLLTVTIKAQVTLPMALSVKKAYEKETRSADGKPGKHYWQNKAQYQLQINYEPASRQLTGFEEILYSNNSPDTLNQLVFKLYPNLYQKGAIRDMPVEASDLTDGVQIESLQVNGNNKNYVIKGTNMFLPYITVLPGQTLQLRIHYRYTVNQTSHIRTGEIEKGAAFLAYTFPRIAVYDDVDGWNLYPYTGTQEMYNDFCDFKVAITVPENYLVWATGDLINGAAVLAPAYFERLQKAEKENASVFIVDEADLQKGSITRQNSINTWQFSATNVPDFAFAISDHYVWKSTSVEVDRTTGRRTRVDAVFNPTHKDYFEALEVARKTVQLMSDTFPRWPFPYPHITVFDGLDQMEYPMMVNDNPVPTSFDLITLTDHEIFHTMFPFYMGTNETKYAWMDEGWATLGEWLLSPLIDASAVDDYGMSRYEQIAGKEADVPISTLSTLLNDAAYTSNSYEKPAMGYLYVKDMLGTERFLKALHFYLRQWNGKHPLPYDFFNCMNTGSQTNLNWFWNNWFYENGYADLAIHKVSEKGNYKQVWVERVGKKMVPIDLTITYEDGTTQKIHRSIAVWQTHAAQVRINWESPKKIRRMVVGSRFVPDVNFRNNIWPVQP